MNTVCAAAVATAPGTHPAVDPASIARAAVAARGNRLRRDGEVERQASVTGVPMTPSMRTMGSLLARRWARSARESARGGTPDGVRRRALGRERAHRAGGERPAADP